MPSTFSIFVNFLGKPLQLKMFTYLLASMTQNFYKLTASIIRRDFSFFLASNYQSSNALAIINSKLHFVRLIHGKGCWVFSSVKNI